ncbi:MAG: hypothetical protein ACWA5P_02015 [bacterium]
MAGKGTYAALQRLQPLQQDFTEDLRFAENQGFRYRREQQINDARADRKKAGQDQFKVDAAGKLKTFQTGFASIDEGVAQYIQEDLVNQLNDQFEILEKNPDNWRAKLSIEQIIKQPEELKTLFGGLISRAQELDKGIKDGTYSANLNQNVIRDFETLLKDKKFGLRFINGSTNLFVDTDGDGINDAQREGLNLQNMFDDDALGTFHQRFDVEKWVKDKVDLGIGISENVSQKGFTTTETKGVKDQYVNDLTREIDQLLGDDENTLTWQARSLFADYKIPVPTNDAEFKQAKLDLASRVLNTVDESTSTKINQSALTSRMKENRLSKKESAGVGEVVTPTVETWGKKFDSIDPTSVNSVPVNNVKLDALTLSDLGKTITDGEVTDFTYDKDGNMLARVVYQETIKKTVKEDEGERTITIPGEKKNILVKISDENESKIATQVAGSIEGAKKLAYKNDSDKQKVDTSNMSAQEKLEYYKNLKKKK